MKANEKKIRILMLSLMKEDWEKDAATVKQVQQLASLLAPSLSSISYRPELPSNEENWEFFTREDFLYLISQGYYLTEICTSFNVSHLEFRKWREANGFFEKSAPSIRLKYKNEIENIRREIQ